MSIYCVYRITNLIKRKHYYGYKACDKSPRDVIGVSYFSSSTDKEFKTDQKLNPRNYRYKVVAIFNSHKDALSREIKLHNMFDVKNNPRFYNKVNQTAKSFDITGRTAVKDSDGNIFLMSCEEFKTAHVVSYNNSEQTTKTKLEKYGSKTYCNTEQIKNTMLKRYGVENIMYLEEIKNKVNESAKATRLKKFGHEYSFQVPELMEKMKETWKTTGRNLGEKHPLAKRIIIEAPDGTKWETFGNFKSTIKEISKTYKISYKILTIILKKLEFPTNKSRIKYVGWKCDYI